MNRYLQLIYDLSIDYDGYENDIEGLRCLVDELRRFARMGITLDDKTPIYVNGHEKHENILGEELKDEDLEETSKWI